MKGKSNNRKLFGIVAMHLGTLVNKDIIDIAMQLLLKLGY